MEKSHCVLKLWQVRWQTNVCYMIIMTIRKDFKWSNSQRYPLSCNRYTYFIDVCFTWRVIISQNLHEETKTLHDQKIVTLEEIIVRKKKNLHQTIKAWVNRVGKASEIFQISVFLKSLKDMNHVLQKGLVT